MKSFKNYLESEIEKELLQEDITTIIGTLFGLATTGLVIGWGTALIAKGYKGLYKYATALFAGDKIEKSDLPKIRENIKSDQVAQVQKQKDDSEKTKYQEELEELFAAIKDKNEEDSIKALQNINRTPAKDRVIINEIVKTFEAPPIHFGNTGNDCYLFIKKLYGIKTAKSIAEVVKKSIKKQAEKLMNDEE